MPACFSTLPPEVSLQIVRNVEQSGWLLHLALSCRSLYHLTIPHLYSNVKLFYKNYKTGFPYLKSLTVHILKNPELASHVRGFAMDQSFGNHDPSFDESGSWEFDETVQEVVFRSSLSQEQQKVWMGLLKNGDKNAYAALLLSSLPNLERLELVVPTLSTDCFGKLVQKAAKRERLFHIQPAFSSLRVLVHHCYYDPYSTSPKLLSDYLRLPSLRTFCMHNFVSCNQPDKDLAALEPATLPLVHLELRSTKLTAIDLTNMLRAFKHLKTFVSGLDVGRIHTHDYSMVQLFEALSLTKDTLENLWLGCGEELYFSHNRSPTNLSQRTLFNFKALRNLRVDMYIYLGVPRTGATWVGADGQGVTPDLATLMPASIETLYFSQTRGMIHVLTRALEKLLQAKESCTPKLRRIAFKADVTGVDKDFDYSHLDFLAGEAGVEIRKIDGKEAEGREMGWREDGSLTVSTPAELYAFLSIPLFESLDIMRRRDTFPASQPWHQAQVACQGEEG